MARIRLTGLSGGASGPGGIGLSGGLQWDIVPSDTDIVENVIDELEGRQLLWGDMVREQSDRCIASAAYMREFIGTQLRTPSGVSKPLKAELKMMRRHFITFMNDMQDAGLDKPGFVDPVALERVIGWLRTSIGDQVGLLAAQYKVDVSDELASIVPNQNDWFFVELGP